jgi:BirA family transcriptional regulator, biotin operon repressor / biotin---[acetyl-CoA-carboxylase] ligase
LFTDNHIKLETINSTNDYAISLKETAVFKEGLVVTANYQSGGNGQRGKAWESNANENLLLSVIIQPNIAVENQFEISKIIALSVCDLLTNLGLNSKIKWPNDILITKEKVAGILIQNILKGTSISHSVIGIGLNINQLQFKKYSPKATSLQLLMKKEFDIAKISIQLLQFLAERMKQYRNGFSQDQDYLSSLYLKDKVAAFESKDLQFMGIIKGVNQNGKLLIKTEDDTIKAFDSQEVKFLF